MTIQVQKRGECEFAQVRVCKRNSARIYLPIFNYALVDRIFLSSLGLLFCCA